MIDRKTVARKTALEVWCPRCGAGEGANCATERVDQDGTVHRKSRRALHLERHTHAIRLGARPVFWNGQRIHYG